MPGGSGGGTTETTQTSEPWSGQQAALRDIYSRAMNLPAQSPYPFPTFTPYSPETAESIEARAARARGGNPLLPAGQAQALATTQGGYLGQAPGLEYLTPSATGQVDVGGYAGAPQMAATAGGQNLDVMGQYPGAGQLYRSSTGRWLGAAPGAGTLEETARGDYLWGSPGFDAAFEAARRQIQPAVQSQFALAGRSGSGLEQAEATRAMSDAWAQLYGQERERQLGAAGELGRQFGAERQLMDTAASRLAGLGAGERGFQEAAASRLADLYGGERAFQERARMGAADLASGAFQAERNRMLQSAFGAPGLAAADYGDIGQLGAAGAQQEAKAGEALADAIRRYEFQMREPYERLGFASQIIQGGYPGGTVTSQVPNQKTSPLAGALGGGMLGAGAASLPLFAGTGFAPWLPAVGAGLGLMMQ